MKVLSLLLWILPAIATGGELECLASIMHSEANGESLLGIIAVAQSSINRSKITKRSICTIRGVTRRSPPDNVAKHYVSLARSILAGGISIVGTADSWDRALKPKYAGRINRRIGRHTFYTSKRLN